jgi:organic radical activating enzyme
MGSVMEFGEDYNEVSLTGGEPLLYADLISGFLTLFRRYRKTPIFLETNGTLPGELAKVIDKVDIISMDFKLPSSAEDSRDEWAAHEEFYKMSLSKELIVKAVVTGNTKMEDVKKMAEIIVNHGKRPSIVLQPVTVVNDSVRAHDEETLFYFKKYLEKATGGEITVIGQIHKCLGIR